MPRQLLFARVKSALAVANAATAESSLSAVGASDDEKLQDGHMRLYGFYTPSLEGGAYTVSASQNITAYKENTAQTLTIANQHLIKSATDPNAFTPGAKVVQSFNVVAPQFSLEPKLINSYYPPSGHQDEGRILPHIVFNDPHVPWLRDAGQTAWSSDPIPGAPAGGDWSGRSKVPWMAIMVFEPSDLVVDDTAATGLELNKLDSWIKAESKPPSNGAYGMSVLEFLGLKSRVKVETGLEAGSEDLERLLTSTERTSAIFPTKSRVLETFTVSGGKSLVPLNALQMLSHVRHVNNKGMPDYDPTQTTYFSVLISSITGAVKARALTTQIVHLVSIEHLDTTIQDGLSGASDRIGLISLFSWVYACVPESADFATTMEALAASSQPLRAPDSMLQDMSKSIEAEENVAKKAGMMALNQRLQHGYTISRWRAPTGEESVAFNRGPIVPVHLPSPFQVASSPPAVETPHQPSEDWPVTSMTGKNYLIYDKSVGITDATYASAWSLGKLMAISDAAFTAALMRFRSRTRTSAVSATLTAVNGLRSKKAILARAETAASKVESLAAGDFAGSVSRLCPAPHCTGPKVLCGRKAERLLPVAIEQAVEARSLSAAGSVFTGLDGEKAVDSDWKIVSSWIHDTLYLAHVPAHYLFPDPSYLRGFLDKSHLPKDLKKLHPEALRFFSVDDTWIDCFIDGGLSCANHVDPQHDAVRLSIKHMINEALSNGGPFGTAIPVPKSGFVVRSSAVKAAPDLKVIVTRYQLPDATTTWTEDAQHDPILRLTRLDDFTILCLLDCALDQVCKITLAQPPHQQRFALSVSVTTNPDTDEVESVVPALQIKALYTNASTAPEGSGKDGIWPELPYDFQFETGGETGFYDPATRRISADEIARGVVGKLSDWNKANGGATTGPYTDPVPDSCVLGLQLSDPCYQLEISGTPPTSTQPFEDKPRQLWVGSTAKLAPGIASLSIASASKAATATTTTAWPTLKMPETPTVTSTISAVSLRQDQPAQPTQAPRLLLNKVSAIPRTLAAAPAPSRKPTVPPPDDSKDCQFELLLHPDYRQPPPRPKPAYKYDPRGLYSPQTLLPISPVNLYDLVIAIRRRPRHTTGRWELKKMFIEIPVEDGSDTRNPGDNLWREPLLVGGNYAGRGVHMTSNQRFVPTLSSGVSSDDGKECLRITLVPRSGQTEGTMTLRDDRASAEASVRLAEVRLAGIVDSRTRVLIARLGGPSGPGSSSVSTPAGRCFVKMTEVYASGQQDQRSWAIVLKTGARDKDGKGNDM